MVLTPEKRLRLHEVMKKVLLAWLEEAYAQTVAVKAALQNFFNVLESVADATLDVNDVKFSRSSHSGMACRRSSS